MKMTFDCLKGIAKDHIASLSVIFKVIFLANFPLGRNDSYSWVGSRKIFARNFLLFIASLSSITGTLIGLRYKRFA